jgi:hypothetical protein
MKLCNSCGITKPLESFALRSARKCGVQSTCKDCRSAHYLKTLAPSKAVLREVKIAAAAIGKKLCGRCKQVKERDDYASDKSRHDGLSAKCKACCKLKATAYYEKNSEKEKTRTAAFAAENRDYYIKYRKKNSASENARGAKWRAENPDRERARSIKYRTNNPDKVAAKTAKYRSAKLRATPIWADLVAVEAFYSESARITRETGIEHHVDHIVPLQSKLVCGLHVANNLRVLPGTDNKSKGNRHWPDMP